MVAPFENRVLYDIYRFHTRYPVHDLDAKTLYEVSALGTDNLDVYSRKQAVHYSERLRRIAIKHQFYEKAAFADQLLKNRRAFEVATPERPFLVAESEHYNWRLHLLKLSARLYKHSLEYVDAP